MEEKVVQKARLYECDNSCYGSSLIFSSKTFNREIIERSGARKNLSNAWEKIYRVNGEGKFPVIE